MTLTNTSQGLHQHPTVDLQLDVDVTIENLVSHICLFQKIFKSAISASGWLIIKKIDAGPND